jgi:ribosomal protein S14
MKREIKNIKIDWVKKKLFLKNEIKSIIMRSIFQNRYIPNVKRCYMKVVNARIKKKSSIAFQKKRCVVTGQSNSVYKNFEINRHVMKRFNNVGLIQGVTLKKW